MAIINVSPLTSPPKTIINKWSAGGVAKINLSCYTNWLPKIKSDLSGALVADTYKEIISVTGAGVLEMAAVATEDATSRSIGIKVILDGVTAFDASSAVEAASSDFGMVAVGGIVSPSSFSLLPQDYPFYTSLSIQVKSSLSETDKVRLFNQHRTT